MPKVDPNSMLANLRGSVGDFVFLELNGRLVVRRKPKRTVPRTEAEKAQNQRLTNAARYAKSVLNDPVKHADYAKIPRPPGLGVFHIAVRDFHRAPVVEDIDLAHYTGKSGERIPVRATDDTGVIELAVQIKDMDGGLLEEGLAQVDAESGAWIYSTTRDVPSGHTVSILASAKDRPGNITSRTALGYAR